MTSTAEQKAFLSVAVTAIPRVAEIILGYPPDDRAGALEAAERRFLAAALDYGCTEIAARSRVSVGRWRSRPMRRSPPKRVEQKAARQRRSDRPAGQHGLQKGGRLPADVNWMARDHGLTPKVIRSAREALGVKIERDGFGPGSKSLWSSVSHKIRDATMSPSTRHCSNMNASPWRGKIVFGVQQ